MIHFVNQYKGSIMVILLLVGVLIGMHIADWDIDRAEVVKLHTCLDTCKNNIDLFAEDRETDRLVWTLCNTACVIDYNGKREGVL